MKSFSEIKEELYEIRYYYSMKDLFDAGAEIVNFFKRAYRWKSYYGRRRKGIDENENHLGK